MLKVIERRTRGRNPRTIKEYEHVNNVDMRAEQEFIDYCEQELNLTIQRINEMDRSCLRYVKFKIPKRNGKTREINAPSENLKAIQKEIVSLIRDKFRIVESDNAFAYVKHRSTFMAQERHKDNESKWFLKIDISDFFPSCKTELVLDNLCNIYPISCFREAYQEAFKMLIGAYCFLDGGLPQGAPSSPLLSNLIFIGYDVAINKYLKVLEEMYDTKFVYTRYADDMEISAHKKFDEKVVIEELKKLIHPFVIKDEKTSFGNNNVIGVWCLGILYNNANEFSLGATNRKDLEHAILNMISAVRDGDEYELQDAYHWLGKINYFKQINKTQTEGIIAKYDKKFEFNTMQFLKDIVNKKK